MNSYIFLDRNAMYPVESQLTFQRNMPLPSSGLNNMHIEKPALCYLLYVVLLALVFFDPEDGDGMFL
jgi:hypothetical protein